jgi:aspartyl protease family protein
MSDDRGPWGEDSEDQEPGSSLGSILWIGLLSAIGLGVWALFALLPGSSSFDEDLYPNLVYLVAILAFVSSGIIFTRRFNFSEVARNIAVWTGLAALLLIGYTYRTEIKGVFYRVAGELVPGQGISITENELIIVANRDGHYYVNGTANGKTIRFMVDTGASEVTLSPQDASRIGIDMPRLRFTQKFHTANGIGFGARYWLDSLSIGSFELGTTVVSINKSEMSHSLLGMSFLERLKSFEFRDGKLYLRK